MVRIAGLDECGNGALAGPILACCVAFDTENSECWPVPGVNDSKKLTHKRRIVLATDIYECLIDIGGEIGIGIAEVGEINKYGHLHAWELAMDRAVLEAGEDFAIDLLLIDGTTMPKITAPVGKIVCEAKADGKYFHVAAASILGKVYRDRLMIGLSDECPQFPSWAKSAGYPTPAHIAELKEHGMTKHHREKASSTALGIRPQERKWK